MVNLNDSSIRPMEVREFQKSDIKGILLLHDEFEQEFFEEFYINPLKKNGRQIRTKLLFFMNRKEGNSGLSKIGKKLLDWSEFLM